MRIQLPFNIFTLVLPKDVHHSTHTTVTKLTHKSKGLKPIVPLASLALLALGRMQKVKAHFVSMIKSDFPILQSLALDSGNIMTGSGARVSSKLRLTKEDSLFSNPADPQIQAKYLWKAKLALRHSISNATLF